MEELRKKQKRQLNLKKTRLMILIRQKENIKIKIDHTQLEQVNNFNLRVLLQNNRTEENEIRPSMH